MRALMRLAVLIGIVALFIFLGVLIFGGHGSKPSPTPVTGKSLPEYADTDVLVRLTIDGEINANEAHRQIVITVGQGKRTLQVNKGYQGDVVKSESFGNNQDAYSAFLHSLSLSGFTLSRTSKFPNEQGQCPLGQRYIYEVTNNGKHNMRTWSTNCGSSGSFHGQSNLVRELFENQIDNYSAYTSDVEL